MKSSVILIFVICIWSKAQTHCFIYDLEYKKDSTSQLTTKENYNLDISKDKILYYARDYYIADSLIDNNIPFPKDLKLATSYILSQKPGSSTFTEYDILENTILKLQTDANQNWKLTGDKKQVKNLSLQKATTTWGGRNWTAFFCAEIPFQEGPYKFHGLPGLIVELFDDKNNYHFDLAKSQILKKKKEPVHSCG